MSFRRIALTGIALTLGAALAAAATPFGRNLMFHVVPLRWTDEAARLAQALDVGPGSVVADIGAGDGALITELARIVGPQGRTFASERTSEQRATLESVTKAAGVTATILEAADHSTNLPDACCDAITMRMVMHHIADPVAFGRDLRRAIRAGGRVGIIDFAPGVVPHLADDHGVAPDRLVAAFAAAGFDVAARDDTWGGGTYLIAFRPR